VQYLRQSDVSTACPCRATEEGSDDQGARRDKCARAGGGPRQDTVVGTGIAVAGNGDVSTGGAGDADGSVVR
jgi:hypothetical protein